MEVLKAKQHRPFSSPYTPVARKAADLRTPENWRIPSNEKAWNMKYGEFGVSPRSPVPLTESMFSQSCKGCEYHVRHVLLLQLYPSIPLNPFSGGTSFRPQPSLLTWNCCQTSTVHQRSGTTHTSDARNMHSMQGKVFAFKGMCTSKP